MAIDASDLLMTKMMEGDRDTGLGGSGFLWVIMIFLFFLAFSGTAYSATAGLWPCSRLRRTICLRWNAIFSQATAHLFERRKDRAEQLQPEPVYYWPARQLVQQSLCEPLPLL